MSDSQQIDSPDQRYAILLTSNEMRMSHSVINAALWARTPQRLLLEIGDWQWSSEQIVWSADSERMTIGLRRYPGDAPGIVIDIYPERQIIIPHAPAETQPLPFATLDAFLERYYAQRRSVKPCIDHTEAHLMQPARTLASLFEDVPRQWGLRGDPHLWQELKATLGNAPYPATEEQLAALLEQTYQQLTGMPLSHQEPFFIERLSHGGMSSGYVSPQFWAATAIPFLRARYRDTH